MTLRDAAAEHLAAAGLAPDGGVDERWVKMKIGPIPFAFPNTRARKRLVLAHDLHHLLAGYSTNLVGEAEMGAWELGSGMTDRTGVRLAVRILGFALPRYWARLFRAFVRGRRCRNLVGRPLDDATLDRSVAEMRVELGLDQRPGEPTSADRRAFRVWAAKGIAVVWGPILPMGIALWWWLR